MKVLFLDIDGVLNSFSWNKRHQREIANGSSVDERKVRLLSDIIAQTDVMLVLHLIKRRILLRNRYGEVKVQFGEGKRDIRMAGNASAGFPLSSA